MVMAAAALLRKNRNPSDEDIAAALTNLCRCGIYPRLIDAVERAARLARGEDDAAPVEGDTPVTVTTDSTG
jgi:isoquinoline 1-oxidoreductase alpha subunit